MRAKGLDAEKEELKKLMDEEGVVADDGEAGEDVGELDALTGH